MYPFWLRGPRRWPARWHHQFLRRFRRATRLRKCVMFRANPVQLVECSPSLFLPQVCALDLPIRPDQDPVFQGAILEFDVINISAVRCDSFERYRLQNPK